MATDLAEDAELTSEDSAPEEPTKRFGLGNKKLKILVLLVIVMGVEGAALFFFIPKVGQVNSDGSEDGSTKELDEEDTIEVEIGKFVVTNDQKDGEVSMHLKFTITGVVNRKSESDFRKAVNTDHPALVRETIEGVWRRAEMVELSEPDLGAIKNSLREKINKKLKKDYIRHILVSGFTKTQYN